MGTSGTGNSGNGGQGGFTLLEICLALAMVVFLLGIAVPQITSWLTEERLRDPARDVELLARTARLRAIDTQKSWAVVIHPDSLSLALQPGEAPEDDGSPNAGDLSRAIPSEVSVETQAWGETSFSSPAEVRWVFHPDGLCTPLTVRFTRGESRIALRFDPLTADVAEETYAFH